MFSQDLHMLFYLYILDTMKGFILFYYVVSLKAVMPIKAPYFYKCNISQFIDMAHKGHDWVFSISESVTHVSLLRLASVQHQLLCLWKVAVHYMVLLLGTTEDSSSNMGYYREFPCSLVELPQLQPLWMSPHDYCVFKFSKQSTDEKSDSWCMCSKTWTAM